MLDLLVGMMEDLLTLKDRRWHTNDTKCLSPSYKMGCRGHHRRRSCAMSGGQHAEGRWYSDPENRPIESRAGVWIPGKHHDTQAIASMQVIVDMLTISAVVGRTSPSSPLRTRRRCEETRRQNLHRCESGEDRLSAIPCPCADR